MPRGRDEHQVNLIVTQLKTERTKGFFPNSEMQTPVVFERPHKVEHNQLIYFRISKNKVNLLEIERISIAQRVSLEYNV